MSIVTDRNPNWSSENQFKSTTNKIQNETNQTQKNWNDLRLPEILNRENPPRDGADNQKNENPWWNSHF